MPSKTLIATAAARWQMQRAAAYGLPAVDLPPVVFAAIRTRIRQVISAIEPHDSIERFARLGVAVRQGQAQFDDAHTVIVDGQPLSARTWVIATGSEARLPRVPGAETVPLLTNRTVFDLDRLVILGGGPGAIEMAQAFCRLGSQVQVVQRSAQILSREDRDLADQLMHCLSREGVEFVLQSNVTAIAAEGSTRCVTISDAQGRSRRLEADAILVAQGRQHTLVDLAPDRAGVAYTAQGLVLDRRLRTTATHIYAAGDVTGRYQFTHAAGYEAGVVIANAVLHLPRRVEYRWMPWCTYADPELASIGLNERRAQEANVAYRVQRVQVDDNDRGRAEGGIAGEIKILLDRRQRVLGVQILGPQAGELLHAWVLALAGRVSLTTIATAVQPYPKLAESSRRAAGDIVSSRLFSPQVRWVLKTLFGYRGQAPA